MRLNKLIVISIYCRIMVMDGGKVVEFEPPNALLDNTSSMFYGLVRDAGLI